MDDRKPEPLTAGIVEHRYSLREPPRWLLVLFIFVTNSIYFTVHTASRAISLDKGPASHRDMLEFFAGVAAVFLAVAALVASYFIRITRERIVVGDDDIRWYGRTGRLRTQCSFSDVLGWKRMPSDWNGPAYRVITRKGQIWYTSGISRRAELDRFFLGLTGEQLPEALPIPRTWPGPKTYRCTSGKAVVIAVFGILLGILFIRLVSIASWSGIWDWCVCLLILGLGTFFLSKAVLESVTIADRILICRNFLGRIVYRVPIDDIVSVDANLSGWAARVYTQSKTLRLDPMLNDYEDLVYRLQCLVASPNP